MGGGAPSPFDRNMGTKLAATTVEWMTAILDQNDPSVLSSSESAVVLGIVARHKTLTPITDLVDVTDFNYRVPKEQWWLRLRPLMKILAKHLDTYTVEGDVVEDE